MATHLSTKFAAPLMAAVSALAVTACGVGAELSDLSDRAGVALGETDRALLGTFRLSPDLAPGAGMLSLLILREDATFTGVVLVSCRRGRCTSAPISGQYRQLRELPDPTKASAVALEGSFLPTPSSEEYLPLTLTLRRGLVPDSPQIGLFYPSSDSETPYFALIHPTELWCEDPADCAGQGSSCTKGFTCIEGACSCPP